MTEHLKEADRYAAERDRSANADWRYAQSPTYGPEDREAFLDRQLVLSGQEITALRKALKAAGVRDD